MLNHIVLCHFKLWTNPYHTLLPRDRHRLAGPHGCMVQVVAAMASGQDIATRAPPVPMPRVVWVFSHARVILNLCTPSQIGGSLSDCPSSSTFSATFHPRFLLGDFRIVLSFMSSRLPPTAFPHGGFWDPARRRVGWVRQEVVYCYTAGMFSLFLFLFFANFQESFAAKSPHSTFLADGHGRLLPRGPTRPHYRPRQQR